MSLRGLCLKQTLLLRNPLKCVVNWRWMAFWFLGAFLTALLLVVHKWDIMGCELLMSMTLGFFRSTHSRGWEKPQISDKGIAFICFDGGYFIWVASRNSVWLKGSKQENRTRWVSQPCEWDHVKHSHLHTFSLCLKYFCFSQASSKIPVLSEELIIHIKTYSFNIFTRAATSFSCLFICWVFNKA